MTHRTCMKISLLLFVPVLALAGCPPTPPAATVPDVLGMAQADAGAALSGAGLATGTVTTQYSDTVAEGAVISQDPPAGSEVAPGTPVTLVVSMGPEPQDPGAPGDDPGEPGDDPEDPGEPANPQTSALGMNLAAPNHSSDVAFVDLMHTTNGFVDEATWSRLPDHLDANGWPTQLDGPAIVSLMGWAGELGPYMPAGDYILLYEGEGVIEVDGATEVAGSRTVTGDTTRVLYRYQPSDAGVLLRLVSTDPNGTGNYLRNIRFLLPGHEDDYATQVFNPAFLDAWRDFACFRHVQSMQVWPFQSDLDDTEEPVLLDVEWSDRARPEDFRWGQRWSYDIAVALSNRLDAGIWVTIPHTASRDYVVQLAAFLVAELEPGLTVYIEYTNEPWNPMSATNVWLREQGVADGLGTMPGLAQTGDEYVIAMRKYSQLAVEYCGIVEDAFAAAGRGDSVVSVYGGNENTYHYDEDEDGVVNGNELGALYVQVDGQPAYTYFDAWGTTSYVGGALGFEYQRTVMDWSVDDLFTYIESGTQPATDSVQLPVIDGTSIKEGTLAATLHGLEEMHAFAQRFGMHHVIYEGGPHLVALPYGVDAQGDDFTLTDDEMARLDGLFNQAIVDDRFGAIMADLLAGARAAGARTHVMFNSCELPGLSQWSKFGFLDHIYQDPATSPKYAATAAWMADNPRWWTSLQRGEDQ